MGIGFGRIFRKEVEWVCAEEMGLDGVKKIVGLLCKRWGCVVFAGDESWNKEEDEAKKMEVYFEKIKVGGGEKEGYCVRLEKVDRV